MTEQTPSPENDQENPDALDALLERVALHTPAGLDVEGALRQVHQRMREPDVRPLVAWRTTTVPSRWMLTAIAAAAMIVAVAGLNRARDKQAAAGIAAAQPRVIFTVPAQRDSADLADGTHVVLEPSTQLTIDPAYGARRRSVALRGDARFAVPHDTAHPFTIRSGGAVITDLGTVFDVHGGDDGTAVSVRSGSVRLAGESDTIGVVLSAGDRALRNATLDLARVELKRWYGLEIAFADPALAARHVTSTFPAESPKLALDLIALTLGARYDMRGDTAVLRSLPPATPR